MAIDFTRYRPPGVYTENVGGPQLAVRTSVPTAVAIFGLSVGYRTHRESLTINADAPAAPGGDVVPSPNETLAKTGILVVDGSPVVFTTVNVDLNAPGSTFTGKLPDDLTGPADDVTPATNDLVYLAAQTNPTQNGLYRFTITAIPGASGGSPTNSYSLVRVVDTFKVVNPATGYTYINGLDYQIVQVSSGDAALTTSRDDTYTIKRIDRGSEVGIQEGDVVQVSYRYTGVDRRRSTEGDYFDVFAYYDYDDVRDHYGEPFAANGTVQSEVTLAAKFAFLNGASTVLTCAVDTESRTADGDVKPLSQCYQDALDKFRDEQQIAIIVPGTGQQYIDELVRQHVTSQSEDKYERRAVLGIDGTAAPVDTAIRQERAQSVSHQRIAMVSPSKFGYYAPELNREVILGGQYMAAAVAGKSVSQIAAMPLTRKTIAGFTGPAESPIQREGEKDLETQNGLLVVEKTRRNQIQVRHGVTTDPTDLLTREWSIIGQQDVMVYRIRDYLDADGLIGMPIYDTTLIQVKASAEAALVSLVRDGVIVGHQNLKVRQLSTMPDVIEVRFEWKPAYPLNYIVVRYSVAVMTGDVTIADATA